MDKLRLPKHIRDKSPEEISAYYRKLGSKNKPSAFRDPEVARKAGLKSAEVRRLKAKMEDTA